MVFRTIIQRNIRLSEAPSFGKILLITTLRVEGQELSIPCQRNFKKRKNKLLMAKKNKKQALGRGLSALLDDPQNEIDSINELV